MTGGNHPELFPVFMLCSLVAGACLTRRYRSAVPLAPSQRAFLGMAAFCGAIFGAKLPFLLRIPGFEAADGLLVSGKTILFGMVGGYVGVEAAKKHLGITVRTGDSFVVPVAVSIGIGRLACFCVGCCYGQPSDLAWAVVFPKLDELTRHPTQIYEAVFHFAAAITCAWMIRRNRLRGQLIKAYFAAYFVYRFLSEFIRPERVVRFGLTSYQITSLILLAIFLVLFVRDQNTLQQQTST